MRYGAQAVGEPDGGRQVEAAVRVDEDLDVVADLGPDRLDDVDGGVVLLGRVVGGVAGQVGGAALERVELEGGVADVHGRAGGAGVLLGRRRSRSNQPLLYRIRLLVELAAEQLVDRQAEHLAPDVPEGDIDAADERRDEAERPERVEAGVQLVPEKLDAGRVFADQDRARAGWPPPRRPCCAGQLETWPQPWTPSSVSMRRKTHG